MIFYTATGNRAKGAVVEWSELADNHRGEILGDIMIQLILRVTYHSLGHQYPDTEVDCDNQGVMIHGNTPMGALKEKQAQGNILRVFKQLVIDQSFNVDFHWVPSHQDGQSRDSSARPRSRSTLK